MSIKLMYGNKANIHPAFFPVLLSHIFSATLLPKNTVPTPKNKLTD